MNFGNAIGELRKMRKIKQYELAKTVNVTPTYISMVENNKREPSPGLLKDIAEALGVAPIILIFKSLEKSDARSGKEDAFEAIHTSLVNVIDEYCIQNPIEK